jgi:hypothetical protein
VKGIAAMRTNASNVKAEVVNRDAIRTNASNVTDWEIVNRTALSVPCAMAPATACLVPTI